MMGPIYDPTPAEIEAMKKQIRRENDERHAKLFLRASRFRLLPLSEYQPSIRQCKVGKIQ